MGVMKRLQYQQQHSGRGRGAAAVDIALDVRLEGTAQLIEALKQFEPVLRKKLARRSTRKAAKPVQASARARVPVRTGLLKKGIQIRSAKRSRKSPIVGVSVITAARQRLNIEEGDKYYYPTIVEYGAASRNIPARPYLRPAIEENKVAVRSIYQSELKFLISETAMQLAAKAITSKGVKIKKVAI